MHIINFVNNWMGQAHDVVSICILQVLIEPRNNLENGILLLLYIITIVPMNILSTVYILLFVSMFCFTIFPCTFSLFTWSRF